MLYRARWGFERVLHNYRCKGVLATDPLRIQPSNLRILSMVSHADLIMYLVAVKSFYKRVGRGKIIIINDGSLTSADCEMLSNHLGSPEFIQFTHVDTNGFPSGGCWERLLTILDLLRDFYVIQLDSDTVTRKYVPEVLECIHSNRSFTLGTPQGRELVNLSQASRQAQAFYADDPRRTHVQDEAERNFFRIPDAEQLLYVRGSAGFAGFAKGSQSRSTAADFSQRMTELIGIKWTDWGSEQVASNYLVANAPRAAVLPYPKYACFDPRVRINQAAFLHFIGTNRYDERIYTRESRSAMLSVLA
jgi:hypothetical protein